MPKGKGRAGDHWRTVEIFAKKKEIEMRKILVLVFILVAVTMLTACSPVTAEQFSTQATQVAELSNQQATQVALLEKLAVPTQEPTAVPATEEVEQAATPEPTVALSTSTSVVVANTLVKPELFDAGEDPAGKFNPGFFDIGVNDNQIGIVFGYNLAWGKHFVKGEGCEIVVLSGGWYENFEILDGRYEIYTLPSSDPTGWTKVLVDQRVAEQVAHYGCDPKVVPPVWEGGK